MQTNFYIRNVTDVKAIEEALMEAGVEEDEIQKLLFYVYNGVFTRASRLIMSIKIGIKRDCVSYKISYRGKTTDWAQKIMKTTVWQGTRIYLSGDLQVVKSEVDDGRVYDLAHIRYERENVVAYKQKHWRPVDTKVTIAQEQILNFDIEAGGENFNHVIKRMEKEAAKANLAVGNTFTCEAMDDDETEFTMKDFGLELINGSFINIISNIILDNMVDIMMHLELKENGDDWIITADDEQIYPTLEDTPIYW